MQAHIRKMIHYQNSLEAGKACAPEEIAKLEEEYRQILEKAKEEYEYIPATEYYKKGYNLYLRLEKYMHNHFLFLYDPRVYWFLLLMFLHLPLIIHLVISSAICPCCF